MIKVFFGGSRKMARLNQSVRRRADSIIGKRFTVLIGDANGADKAMQRYLAEKNYPNVIVFCAGSHCRNNIGGWPKRNVLTERATKDFQFYAAKDKVMSGEADYGFMLWDGSSKGTLNNILNLLERGKAVAVYFAPRKRFVTLRRLSDLEPLLAECQSEAVFVFESQLRLADRISSRQQEMKLA